MKRFSASTFRSFIFTSFLLALFSIVAFYKEGRISLGTRDGITLPQRLVLADKDDDRPLTERWDLSEKQCRTAFPDLFADINYATSRGKVALEKDDGDYKGLVQGQIRNNKLYIISTAPDTIDQILHQRTAILSQLHRALITSPVSLPDTPFAFVVNDNPRNNSWVFARPNKDSDYNVWLMPSFAFWSWPGTTVGAFDDILARIASAENATSWEKKTDKVVWRGTPWFNPLGRPRLRQDLLKAAQNREWADVEPLNGSAGNAIAIEDFCRYKYVVYTEGVTYSGRLPYHQACGSVLITPPLTYLTHTAWLMRPIMASDLVAALGKAAVDSAQRQVPDTGLPKPLLPTVNDWHQANAIYVSPKFSDLEEVVMLLRAHPEVARRIAQNQRDVVAERRYLNGAAEACYWRALVKAWARSAVVSDEWVGDEGERYETWILRQAGKAKGRVHGARDR